MIIVVEIEEEAETNEDKTEQIKMQIKEKIPSDV